MVCAPPGSAKEGGGPTFWDPSDQPSKWGQEQVGGGKIGSPKKDEEIIEALCAADLFEADVTGRSLLPIIHNDPCFPTEIYIRKQPNTPALPPERFLEPWKGF